jgi:hypothetical protein
MVARNLGSTGDPRHGGGADSAGQPWEGREFESNEWTDDDGRAPERLFEALRRFRSSELGVAEVVEAFRDSRLLIPLIAELGESGESASGHLIDKSQELSIVTVSGPDGRTVLPVFTSAATMAAWNAGARPVPAEGTRVALAAASEETDLVVIDPTAETEFVIRRPALWALAQGEPWIPSYQDADVLDAFATAASSEPAVQSIALAAGDPLATLAGPELVVLLTLVKGLDRAELQSVVARLQALWSADEIIASRVDSLRVQLVAAS